MSNQMVYCQACGNRIHVTARSCPRCGAAAWTPTEATTFHGAVTRCLSKYADFSGRASRSEFWLFTLFLILANMVFTLTQVVLPTSSAGVLSTIWAFAMMLPSLAVSVRRMHDQEKSGAHVLLGMLGGVVFILGLAMLATGLKLDDAENGAQYMSPLVLTAGLLMFPISLVLMVWQLMLYCMPGTPGPNRYGDSPG